MDRRHLTFTNLSLEEEEALDYINDTAKRMLLAPDTEPDEDYKKQKYQEAIELSDKAFNLGIRRTSEQEIHNLINQLEP